MAKYTDLRPTRPDDSLKKLLKNTVNKQTIPYGNKVARAHEGTTFFTADGSSYRWDGETIAVYDTRIREAEKAVADAREQLAQAQADLADAKDRIGASSGDLSGYADRIKAAEETLAAAVKDQASLTEKIKAAEQGLSSLEGEVTQAQAQASRAVTAANGKSTNFYGSATPSNPKTGDTWFTEGSFKTWDGKEWVEYTDPKISAAQAAADTAKASADGKNQIFRQSSQPTAKAKGDVWFNTGSGNQIKVWDGRAWVDNLLGTTAIADAAITTAKIGALDASKITTGTLSADRIGTGAVTADKLAGKSIDASKIVNGSITGVLIQNGAITANKFQAGTITANSGIIASLDAGVISTGTLDAGRIGAKTITGDKINAESVAAAVGQFVKVDAKNLTVTQELAANIAKVMSLDAKKLIVNGEALIANATLLGDTVADRLNVTKKLVARDAIVDGTLDVAQLNVTEKMAAEIVNAMSVSAKKLVVTEDAILNNLTVIQNIVTPELIAQKINAKELGAEIVTAGGLQTDEAPSRGIKINSKGIIGFDSTGAQTINIDGSNNQITGQFSTGPYGKPRVNIYNRYNGTWGIDESVIDLQASGMAGISSYDNAVTRLTSSAREGFSISLGATKRLVIENSGIALNAPNISLGGDVSVSSRMRVNRGFLKSSGFHAASNGPYTINPNSILDVNLRFVDLGTKPFILPTVSFDDAGDVNLSIWKVTTNSARVRIYNSGSNKISGLYLDTVILHLER